MLGEHQANEPQQMTHTATHTHQTEILRRSERRVRARCICGGWYSDFRTIEEAEAAAIEHVSEANGQHVQMIHRDIVHLADANGHPACGAGRQTSPSNFTPTAHPVTCKHCLAS